MNFLNAPLNKEKIFVGRENIQEEFWQNLKTSEYKLLNYYGMTGIGKTGLLKNLHKEKNKDRKIALIDLDEYFYKEFENNNSNIGKIDLLLKIRNKLVDEYKYKFEIFDFALYVYYKKIGVPASRPEVKLISANEKLESVIDIASHVFAPFLVILDASTIVEMAISFLKRGKIKEKDFDQLTTSELYDALSVFFAIDLNKNTDKEKSPLVIMIDTYETLNRELDSKIDSWLHSQDGIIATSSNVIWTIASRTKLDWNLITDKKISCRQIKLPKLTKEEVYKLLTSYNIKDKEIFEMFYQNSEGIPLYLNLYIDCYRMLKEQGIEPTTKDFSKNHEKLANNIIKYMNIEEQEILEYLACFDRWDDRFIRDEASKFITCFSYLRYNKLKNISIIEKNEANKYSLIKPAKTSIYNNCDDNIITIVNRNLSEYYKRAIKDETLLIDDEIEILKGYVRTNILNEQNNEIASQNFNEVKNNFEDMKKFIKYKEGLEILDAIYVKFKDNLENNIEFVDTYVQFLMSDSCFEKAIKIAKENYRKYQAEKIKDERFIKAKGLLAQSYVAFGEFDKAEKILKPIVDVNNITENNLNFAETLSNVFMRQNKNKEATDLINNIIVYKKNNDINTNSSMRKAAGIYSNLGQYDEALKIYNDLISQTHKDSLEYLRLINNRAYVFSRQGFYQKSYDDFYEVYNKRKKKLGEKHRDTLNAQNNVALGLSFLKKNKEAIEVYEKVYESRKSLLGAKHPDTISTLNNQAMSYYFIKKYKRAYELLKFVLDYRENAEQRDEIQILNTKNNLSMVYYELKKYKEAFKLAEEVYNDRVIRLGKEHQDTLITATVLGKTYINLNKPNKGKKILKETIDTLKNVYGEKHPLTKDTMKQIKDVLNK